MSRKPRPRRQYAMTPQTPVQPLGQEAAVAVLQTTTRHLEERVSELVKSTNDGNAAIGQKLDKIAEQSTLLATLQAEQTAHSTGLARAFERLDAHDKRLLETDKKAATARGGLIVLGAVGAVIFTVVGWLINPILEQSSLNTRLIYELTQKVERLEAKNQP